MSSGLEAQGAYTYGHSLGTPIGQLVAADCAGAPGMDTGVSSNTRTYDYGPSCFDLRHNFRLSLLYHLPNLKSKGVLSKFADGWWIGNIVSLETGFPFTPILANNRSNSGNLSTGSDRVDINNQAIAQGTVPRLLERVRKTLPLVSVELREGPETTLILGIQSGSCDISIGHLGESYDQIESTLLLRESIVVALPKGHKATRKKTVGLRDLEGELFIIPSKDVLPSLHQMIVTVFAQHHVPLNRYQMVEHFQTAVALTKARAGVAFLPVSAKAFVPVGVVLRPTNCSIRPLQTFALWSRGNVDPLVQRVLNLLKEVSRDL